MEKEKTLNKVLNKHQRFYIKIMTFIIFKPTFNLVYPTAM